MFGVETHADRSTGWKTTEYQIAGDVTLPASLLVAIAIDQTMA
jgi:hypothetical protein